MTQCATCGADGQTGVGFCTQCGARLAPPASPAVETTSTPTNGLAVASLVCGVLGISAVALVLGYVGRSQIRRSRPPQRGAGLALAGIVLGWIGIAASVTVLVVLVVAASNSSNTDAAVGGDALSPGAHVVTSPTTAFSTASPTSTTRAPAATTTTRPGLPADVVTIANELAAHLSAHDFAAVRALEPSKADWSDEYFDSLDLDLVRDTIVPLRTSDAGSGWTALEGGLVAEETGKTRLFCFRWTVNPSLHQIDETGPTRLVRDLAPGADVASLEAELRSTC